MNRFGGGSSPRNEKSDLEKEEKKKEQQQQQQQLGWDLANLEQEANDRTDDEDYIQ